MVSFLCNIQNVAKLPIAWDDECGHQVPFLLTYKLREKKTIDQAPFDTKRSGCHSVYEVLGIDALLITH